MDNTAWPADGPWRPPASSALTPRPQRFGRRRGRVAARFGRGEVRAAEYSMNTPPLDRSSPSGGWFMMLCWVFVVAGCIPGGSTGVGLRGDVLRNGALTATNDHCHPSRCAKIFLGLFLGGKNVHRADRVAANLTESRPVRPEAV